MDHFRVFRVDSNLIKQVSTALVATIRVFNSNRCNLKRTRWENTSHLSNHRTTMTPHRTGNARNSFYCRKIALTRSMKIRMTSWLQLQIADSSHKRNGCKTRLKWYCAARTFSKRRDLWRPRNTENYEKAWIRAMAIVKITIAAAVWTK